MNERGNILLFILNMTVAWSWESKPLDMIDDLKEDTVQDTALNEVHWKWITETLSDIKNEKIKWYIEWMWFVWLSAAFLLIIYNGIVILANFWWEDKLAKAKKRLLSLTIWVVVVTSWYFIIKLVVSFIWGIF